MCSRGTVCCISVLLSQVKPRSMFFARLFLLMEAGDCNIRAPLLQPRLASTCRHLPSGTHHERPHWDCQSPGILQRCSMRLRLGVLMVFDFLYAAEVLSWPRVEPADLVAVASSRQGQAIFRVSGDILRLPEQVSVAEWEHASQQAYQWFQVPLPLLERISSHLLSASLVKACTLWFQRSPNAGAPWRI